MQGTGENAQGNMACFVCFRIVGLNLDSDSIERAIGQKATKFRRAGEEDALGLRELDEWSLSTPFPATETRVDMHLGWLDRILHPAADFLAELKGSASLEIYIGFSLYRETNYVSVEPQSLALFDKLGIGLLLALFSLAE